MSSVAKQQDVASRSIVDFDRLEALLAGGAGERYQTAHPFPHISIDGFLDSGAAEDALREIEHTDVPQEKVSYSTYLKFRQSDPARIGPQVSRVIAALNSDRFLKFLERLTGIPHLVADPTLEGGGIHRIGTGGFLKVHTDFNFHKLTGMFRRLNILVYLNPEWDEAWGGAIELWERDMSRRAAAYPPVWNRAVIFSTTDESYHGHPDPLQSPDGLLRNSIALYYYTADAPAKGYRFEHSEMTNYQPRPGESFGTIGRTTHWLHQVEIRHPALRRLTTGLKRLLG